MIYGMSDSKVLTRNVAVSEADRRRFCITDDDILTLKEAGIKEIFTPGTPLDEIVQWVKDNVKPR